MRLLRRATSSRRSTFSSIGMAAMALRLVQRVIRSRSRRTQHQYESLSIVAKRDAARSTSAEGSGQQS